MKKTIAFLNNAGGVGKTAGVASIAALMAADSQRVLLVDLDPQATLTRQFLPGQPDENIGAALWGGPVPIRDSLFRFDIIPSSPSLSDETMVGDNYTCLAQVLLPLRAQYDHIVVDCPPSLGYLSRCAIAAADYIISPVLPDMKSLYGLQHLEDAVHKYATKEAPGIDGIYLSNFNGRRNLDAAVAAKLKELYGDLILDAKIRPCNKVRECLRVRNDVITFAPKSNAAADFRLLYHELIEKLK